MKGEKKTSSRSKTKDDSKTSYVRFQEQLSPCNTQRRLSTTIAKTMPHYKLVKATILFSDFTTVCIQDIAIYKLSFFSSSTFLAFYETLLLLRYSSTNLTWDKLLLFMARNLNKKEKRAAAKENMPKLKIRLRDS